MKGLDLRHFQKVSSDENTTTLTHKDGHSITVAHKPLSKANRKALDALPMATGGMVKKYAEGTPDEPVSSAADDTADQIAADAAAAEATPQATEAPAAAVPLGQQIGHGIGAALRTIGTPIGTAIGDATDAFKNVGNAAFSGVTGVVQGAAGQPLAPVAAESAGVPAQETERAPAAAEPPPQPAAADPPGAPGYLQQAFQMENKGLEEKYQAEKMAAEGKQTALQKGTDQSQEQLQDYDKRMTAYQDEREKIFQDLKEQHIDPNHFWNSKDTVGKISTVLGLLVGGLGGNDTTKWLNDQIERDINAQKSNVEIKKGVLGALRDQFQDTNTAATFHRVLMNDQVSHMIDLASAKAATPQAHAAMLMAKGELQKQNGVLMAKMGAMTTLNSRNLNPVAISQSLNTLRMLDPASAKEFETRIIPTVGVADTPVSEKVRESFGAGKTFMDQMDALEKFRQQHRGALIGAAADEGHRLAELARNSFRIAQGEGVFKAGSAQFNEKLIPDPTQVDITGKNARAYADMKLRALKDIQAAAQVHGIKPFPNSPLIPQQAQYDEWAKANPKDPRSKKYLQHIGGQ